MRKQFRDLVPLDTARENVLDLAREPTAVLREPHRSQGRILAETVRAPIDVPGFDRSIMDGYAVRATDTEGAYDDSPVTLDYVGTVPAGRAPDVTVEPGTAVEIATGAVIPPGADAVVKVERTRREDERVLVERPVAPTENVMAAGADISAGSAIVRRGDRLDPRRVGLLSAVGVDEVEVYERPTVGLVSTGEEIVRPSEREELGPAEIFDTNTYALATAVEDVGARPKIYPHAGESYDGIRETLRRAARERDVVLSTGSTSASAEDVVYRVVEEVGELILHGVALKPGKPTVIGRLEGTPVLGLPGNPISALMTFRVFASPLLRREAGRSSEAVDRTLDARLATTVESVEGRTQLLPVGLVESPTRGLLAYPVDKGSGAITSLGDADGYLTIPDATNYVPKGETVDVTLLGREVAPPDVLVGGEYCHAFDRLVDRLETRIRWLPAGSIDGVTRLRDGIFDVALVDLPDAVLDDHGLQDVDRIRGYDRSLGLGFAEGEPPASSASEGFETVSTVAALRRGTGSRWHLEERVADRSVDVRDRPSYAGIAESVADGEVEAGWLPEYEADRHGLAFVPVTTEAVDVLVADDRRDKPGVADLLDELGALELGETVGYGLASNPGSVLTSW